MNYKTAILFIVWVFLLIGAWFVAPLFLRTVLKSQAYVTHILPSSNLSDTQRNQARDDIKNLQKTIAQEKLKGANVRVIDLNLQIGARLAALGHNAKAFQYISTVLTHDSQNKEALFHKAYLFETLALPSDALDAWRTAIERDPQNSTSYEHLATIMERVISDPQQANGIYIEGLVRGGNAISLMRPYANFLERQGENTTALLYWKAISQKDPTDENAKNHVQALERTTTQAF